MRPIHLLFFIPLFAACSQPKDRFVLCGTVPGALDSTQIELFSDDRSIHLSGYIVNEKFELTGSAPVASYCRLSMNDTETRLNHGMDRNDSRFIEANIFVENGHLEFTAPHIDSLPYSFFRYDIHKENNYTLKGSAAHYLFDSYRRKTMELQHRIYRENRAEVDENREPDMKAIALMKKELRQITREFIASNRNLGVNLYLAQSLEMEPFTYTQAELDEMLSLFADYTDTFAVLQEFRASYDKAAAYTYGTPFAGGKVFTQKGDTLDLKEAVKPGYYTFIDFWASWCGPCRRSFPHLRKLHEAYGKQVAFISVSVDNKPGAWHKAVKEEKLPWTQYCADRSFVRDMKKMYDFSSIPNFLLVDPQGRIVFSGHESGELEMKLEEIQ